MVCLAAVLAVAEALAGPGWEDTFCYIYVTSLRTIAQHMRALAWGVWRRRRGCGMAQPFFKTACHTERRAPLQIFIPGIEVAAAGMAAFANANCGGGGGGSDSGRRRHSSPSRPLVGGFTALAAAGPTYLCCGGSFILLNNVKKVPPRRWWAATSPVCEGRGDGTETRDWMGVVAVPGTVQYRVVVMVVLYCGAPRTSEGARTQKWAANVLCMPKAATTSLFEITK